MISNRCIDFALAQAMGRWRARVSSCSTRSHRWPSSWQNWQDTVKGFISCVELSEGEEISMMFVLWLYCLRVGNVYIIYIICMYI